jgi:hypothetical protein
MNAFPISPHPIVAFTGCFGSGKTEVAVAYALAAHGQGRATAIVDLDIVTPYFRVGDLRSRLAEEGLEVIAPAGALASFELPALPREVTGALRRVNAHVVLDVGGDPAGARLLGVYAAEIAARSYDMWLVVNPFRPASELPQSIAEQARAIEGASQLRFTGVVSNPHLGPLTQPADIEAGLDQVRRGADGLGLPVVFLAVEAAMVDRVSQIDLPVLPLRRLLRVPWERE